MRSQWKRSEKFDAGSRHFERILKARPHIRDVIPSELAQSSKAKALLFCSKFSCELKTSARAVKPEPKRIGKEEWLSLTCLKRTKNCQRSGSNSYVGMRDSCQKKLENVYVCNEHFTDDCFKTQYRFELVAGNTGRRSLKKNAFRQFFNGRLL